MKLLLGTILARWVRMLGGGGEGENACSGAIVIV